MATETKERQRTIAELLEEARIEKGLSQRKAAETLGTTPTTYRQWMRGQVPGLEWVQPFIAFTGRDKLEVVMAIVESDDRDRVANSNRAKGVYLNSPSRPALVAA